MAYVLQLFGGFSLIGENGEPVALPDRARALLAYLAVVPSPVPRQVLAELLNSEGDEQALRTILRQTLYLTRKAMADSEAICSQDSGLVLNRDLVSTDIDLFRSAAVGPGDRSFKQVADLYRGPFLDGEKSPSPAFEEWLGARRSEFLEQALVALLKLAGSEAAAGRHDSALTHARQALTLDPLREDAHRQVMRCLAAMNQRSNALRQYEIARQVLAEELGVSPEAETEALREAIASGEERPVNITEPMAASRIAANRAAGPARLLALPGWLRDWRRAMVAPSVAVLIIAGGTGAWYYKPRPQPSNSPPSIAVLRFANMSGDPAQDYLGRGVVEMITAMLSTHPGLRVVSRTRSVTFDRTVNVKQLGEDLGTRYLLEGGVRKSAGKVLVTAQLIDAVTGYHVWARQLEEEGDDLVAIQEQIANKVYESLVGPKGAIEIQEQRNAWGKSATSLQEQDYALRAVHFYFQFTKEAHRRARQIMQEGLARFPDSVKLRRQLALSYRHGVEAGWSEHPEQDLAKACQLAREASVSAPGSRYDQWQTHWFMAKIAQWCWEDYERSVAEAKAAVEMVPYDASSLADLAELMANAGRTREAMEWLREAVRRDPKGPEWYRANLAWAYYLAGQYEKALAELQKLSKPRLLLLAALHVKLGQLPQAQAAMANFAKKRPGYTLADEARKPLIASLRHGWLDDLRTAGLPDK